MEPPRRLTALAEVRRSKHVRPEVAQRIHYGLSHREHVHIGAGEIPKESYGVDLDDALRLAATERASGLTTASRSDPILRRRAGRRRAGA